MLRNPGLRKSVEQPVLDLNFATAQIGSNAAPDSRIDFSRGTNAWFVDSDGLVKKSPHNLILSSETIVHNSSGWLVAGASLEASSESPDGIDGSTKVTWTGVGQLYNFTSGIVAGQTYRFSYYVKLGTKSNNRYAVYDHTNSAFIKTSTIVSGVSSSEWTRVYVEVTAPSGCTQIRFYPDRAESAGETGTTFITGVQVSQHTILPVDNPYIKTEGSAVYAARLDHDPTWFMSAAQEQNLFANTDLDDGSFWGLGRSTIAEQSSVENPFGGTDGVYLNLETSVGGASYIYLFSSTNWLQYVTEGKQYTLSIYAKQFNGQKVTLRSPNDDFRPATFNLDTVSIENQDSLLDNATIEDVGNGWFRCSIVDTISTFNSSNWIVAYLENDFDSPDYGLYYYGLQLEVGSTASAYHRTTGAPYYGEGATPKGLLIEEARTNLVEYSEEFDNADWSKIDGTVSANQVIAPDGTLSADEFIYNSGESGARLVESFTSVSQNTDHTLSCFIKNNGLDDSSIRFFSTETGFITTEFDLTTGTITYTTAGASSSITDYGNGWFRVTLTFDTGSAATSEQIQICRNSSVTGDGTKSFYVWGAQLEEGSFPTSYIQTTGNTVTRNADVATMGPTTGGTELVTNGTFDTDTTGWTAGVTTGTTATVSSGVVTISASTASGAGMFYQPGANTPTVIGRRYRATAELSVVSGSGVALVVNSGYFSGTYGNETITSGTNVTVTLDFTATTTAAHVAIYRFAPYADTDEYKVDNVSVRELYPFEQYNPAEGTVVCSGNHDQDAAARVWIFNQDNSSAPRIDLTVNSSQVINPVVVNSGGTAESSLNLGSYTLGSDLTTAIAFKEDTYAGSDNGDAVSTDTSGAMQAVDELTFGSFRGLSSFICGHISRFSYYPRRLPDETLESLSDD